MKKCMLVANGIVSQKGKPSSYEERMKELEIEYNEFLETKCGKEWKGDWIIKRYYNSEDIKDAGDFGDYLYDFYPEMLM